MTDITQRYTIRPATATDWPQIAGLLTTADLPPDGADQHLDDFYVVVRADSAPAGVAGLEVYGTVALLRSVVVAERGRGQGLGQALVQHVLDAARARGIWQLVLLTTTAADFFPRFGFHRVERAAAPAAVQASREFQVACPASAVVMIADL
jgi:amino-acid N-acetyltransferase